MESGPITSEAVVPNTSTQVVTPWKVTTTGQFNYETLTTQFGLRTIDQPLIDQLVELSGTKASHFLTRQIFFAHQDFDKILEAKANGKEVYLYTGRGPSAEALHLGHMLPMIFTAYLQKVLDCWVVIQMSDEEKFYFKDGTLEEFMGYTEPNTKDIIACGFDPKKTFIFSSFKYESYTRPIVAQINKKMSVHTTNKIYGFDENNTIGQIQWPAYQEAPALCGSFPHLFGDRKDVMCLVPCAVDQAPYFRSIRAHAEQMGYPKPALICAKFLVGLQGVGEKASSTGVIPPIFLNDTNDDVKKKINKYAFSGGRETVALHRELGGDISVDVPYIYLYHFLEDEAELKEIATAYATGKMLSGEIKARLVAELIRLLDEHRSNRVAITPEIYRDYFTMKVQPDVAEAFNKFVDKYLKINITY